MKTTLNYLSNNSKWKYKKTEEILFNLTSSNTIISVSLPWTEKQLAHLKAEA